MDILLNTLHRIETEDEAKVDLLNKVAYEYHRVDISKIKEYAEQALALSNELGYLKGKAEAYTNLGMFYILAGLNDKVLEASEIGLSLALKIKSYGLAYRILNNKGLYYQRLGKYNIAIENYLEAVEYTEKANNSSNKAYILNNIGSLFSFNDHEKAEFYYLKAIESAESSKNTRAFGLAKANLLNTYKEQSKLGDAYDLINEIGTIALETKNNRLRALYYSRLAEYHLYKESPELAIDAYERSIAEFIGVGENRELGTVQEDLANLYFNLGDYEKALEVINQAELSISSGHDYRVIIRVIYFKADVYAALLNFKKATEYYQKGKALSEEKKIDEKEKLALEIELKYQAEKKLLENQLLKSQQRENEAIIKSQQSRNELLEIQIDMESKLNSELIRSNMELERFAHIASHDIKGPIKTITSFSQLLKRSSHKLSKEEQEYLFFIHSSANILASLIDDILEFSKVNAQNINRSEVNLDDLLIVIISTLSVEAKEKEVNINVLQKMPIISADKIKLSRAFQNLISNAIKFSDPNKVAKIDIDYKEHEDSFEFTICDNGIGIRESNKNIFEPFTYLNSKTEYKGTGMGLALCKKIVEQHGGSISYESEFGIGTTFTFNILK